MNICSLYTAQDIKITIMETSINNTAVVTSKLRVVYAIFHNQKSSDRALRNLANHGYSKKEVSIKFNNPDELYFLKSLFGLKIGAIAIGLSAGALVLIYFTLSQNLLQVNLLLAVLFSIAVGAIWGATLGFLIAPQLDLHIKKQGLELLAGDTLLSFRPKNNSDKQFFARSGWKILP